MSNRKDRRAARSIKRKAAVPAAAAPAQEFVLVCAKHGAHENVFSIIKDQIVVGGPWCCYCLNETVGVMVRKPVLKQPAARQGRPS